MTDYDKEMTRVYGKSMEIDTGSVHKLYAERAVKKRVHVDAPTVLSSDTSIENIEKWTSEELERWFPMFELNKECRILEIGFGTGRMTKYITPIAKKYVGIDYVDEFRDLVLKREDIIKNQNVEFLTTSLQDFLERNADNDTMEFNRIFLSGGVFVYINDEEAKECISKLCDILAEDCLIYISEPIALQERLTLNSFYSDNIQAAYSAIYRTEKQYLDLFQPLFDKGFELKISQEFFRNDIKKMKETKQWIFIIDR